MGSRPWSPISCLSSPKTLPICVLPPSSSLRRTDVRLVSQKLHASIASVLGLLSYPAECGLTQTSGKPGYRLPILEDEKTAYFETQKATLSVARGCAKRSGPKTIQKSKTNPIYPAFYASRLNSGSIGLVKSDVWMPTKDVVYKLMTAASQDRLISSTAVPIRAPSISSSSPMRRALAQGVQTRMGTSWA